MRAIIIGAGPSLFSNKHLELLKNSDFDGIIMIPEVLAVRALEAGITPDRFPNYYLSTIEDNIHTKILMDYPIVKQWGKKITCILSSKSFDETKQFSHEIFKNVIEIDRPEAENLSNVGLFMYFVAAKMLNVDEICLIGFDHASNENEFSLISKESEIFKNSFVEMEHPYFLTKCIMNPIQQSWHTQFLYYVKKHLSGLNLYNCTEGGSIFGPGINCMRFSEWLATKQ